LIAEFGYVLPNGPEHIRRGIPAIIDVLPARIAHCVRDLLEHAERLAAKVLEYEREIRLGVRDNELARRAQTRQGVGPITASALVATVGNGHDFKNGRHTCEPCSLWELAPYCNVRLGETDPLSRWARAVQARRGYHRACVAVAAKNARVAWALLTKESAAP